MKKEIDVPEGVSVFVDKKHVKIGGPKGELEREFKHFFEIEIEKKDNKIIITSTSDKKKVKAMVGTIVAHIKNMMKGVTEEFTYKLRAVYTHFPVTIKIENDEIYISNFLGEKTPRIAKIVGNTKVNISGQDITLTGINIEDIAQTAANLETSTHISKKDRRVFQDGTYIISKGK